MNKILLIGNSGDISKSTDGQVTKVRLYREILTDEKIDFMFVDLERFSHHPFKTLFTIKRGIKKCDRIVLITAQRGADVLIPFINHFNRKLNKPLALPMIGVNILHKYIDNLNEKDHFMFMHECNFLNIKPKRRDIKNLNKISFILPENEMVASVVKKFFSLNNVYILENFRKYNLPNKSIKKKDNNLLNLIFVSRVGKEKGIFKLIDAVNTINSNGTKVTLDIFGRKYFNEEENLIFNRLLNQNINYGGVLKNADVINTITQYDVFVFPTQYKSEGTPGVISEALIAGVPIISSNFAQVDYLLKDGVDSLIYNMNDNNELVKSILLLVDNDEMLKKLTFNAKISGERYTYFASKQKFWKYILGLESYEGS